MCLGHTVWSAAVVGFVVYTPVEYLLSCLPSIPCQTMRFQPHQTRLRSSGPDRSIVLRFDFINMRILLHYILEHYSHRNEEERFGNMRMINFVQGILLTDWCIRSYFLIHTLIYNNELCSMENFGIFIELCSFDINKKHLLQQAPLYITSYRVGLWLI